MKTKYAADGSLKNVRPSSGLQWSSASDLAREVCEVIGFASDIQFVSAAARDGITYVTGTAGKPDEWHLLRGRCWEHGYFYVGFGGRIEFPPPCFEREFTLALSQLEKFGPVTL